MHTGYAYILNIGSRMWGKEALWPIMDCQYYVFPITTQLECKRVCARVRACVCMCLYGWHCVHVRVCVHAHVLHVVYVYMCSYMRLSVWSYMQCVCIVPICWLSQRFILNCSVVLVEHSNWLHFFIQGNWEHWRRGRLEWTTGSWIPFCIS